MTFGHVGSPVGVKILGFLLSDGRFRVFFVTGGSYCWGMGDDSLRSVTTDQLEQDFIADERLIGRLRARQAIRLAELDQRQVHHGDGCRTMAEWVSSRADLSSHTAKRLVAVTKRHARPSRPPRITRGW